MPFLIKKSMCLSQLVYFYKYIYMYFYLYIEMYAGRAPRSEKLLGARICLLSAAALSVLQRSRILSSCSSPLSTKPVLLDRQTGLRLKLLGIKHKGSLKAVAHVAQVACNNLASFCNGTSQEDHLHRLRTAMHPHSLNQGRSIKGAGYSHP